MNLGTGNAQFWWGQARRGTGPRRRMLRWMGLFSLCLLLTVSCGGGSPSPSSGGSPASPASDAAAGRVTIGTTLKARTVDPADAYELFSGILLQNLGDRLYSYKPDSTDLVPQLAAQMPQLSADGLTYTIPLRQGVQFHDGEPFNAEAMAFSINRFMTSGGRPAFLLADRVESVTATSPTELTIKLKQPFAAFPAVLAFSGVTPVSPKAYATGKFQPGAFVGTGPYRLAEFSPDRIRLDANPDYWGEKPANQGVDIQVIASAANLYNTFKTGGLDVAYQTLDPEQIRDLVETSASGGWQVIEAGSNVINYLVLNQKTPPLNDLKARQAVAAIVNRDLLNERVFQGQAQPLYSLIPSGSPDHKPVFQGKYGGGDPEQAKALLSEAGFTEAQPLTLEVWYSSGSTVRGLVANTLKAAVEKQMGGLAVIEPKDADASTLFENLGKGTYPSVLLDWYPDYFDSDTFIEPFMSCTQGSVEGGCVEGQSQTSGSFYYSPKANMLVKQQRAERDPAKRQQIFGQLQELLATDVPYVPLWQNTDYVFARGGLKGVAIQPSQQFLLSQIQK